MIVTEFVILLLREGLQRPLWQYLMGPGSCLGTQNSVIACSEFQLKWNGRNSGKIGSWGLQLHHGGWVSKLSYCWNVWGSLLIRTWVWHDGNMWQGCGRGSLELRHGSSLSKKKKCFIMLLKAWNFLILLMGQRLRFRWWSKPKFENWREGFLSS